MKFALRILTALLLIPAILHGGNALAACSNPSGVEGQIIHNDTSNVPQYCDDTNWIAMTGADPSLSDGDYIPNAVNFDGSTYLLRGDDLTGVSDSKTITGSFWLKIDSTANRAILQTLNNNFILRTISGIVTLTIDNPAGTRVVGVYLATDLVPDEWNHIMFSIDTSDTASMRRYVNGVEFTGSIFAPNPFIDDVFDLTSGEYAVGSNPTAISVLEGDIADFWIDFDTFIDLSVQANREKFLNTSGNPVFLGNNGNIPTGSAPDIFLSGDTDNWHTNKASGGGFTENGALTTSLTNPYTQITKIVPDGLVGHWRLDETSGTTIFDSSGNGYDGTITNFTLPATTSNGIIDQGIAFSGSDTRIESTTGFPTGANQPFSISMWVNPDQDTVDGTFFFTDGASNEMVMRTDGDSGALRFSLPNNTAFAGALNLSENFGKWTLITATSDGATMNLYKNSVLIDTEALSAYTLTATSFGVGDRHGGSSNEAKDGIYDDVRIYNRAITADEIAEIYAARDGIRYNKSHRTPEFFDGNQFVSLRPDFTEPGKDHFLKDITNETLLCPDVGDTCSDGSIYAGLSLDGSEIMYATAADAPSSMTFQTGGALAVQVLPINCVSIFYTGTTGPCATGELNTQRFAAVSGTGAPAPYLPIDYCESLDVHGHTDWYLPSQSELGTLNGAKNTGDFNGTFNETGVMYWTSSERDNARSRGIDFSASSGVISASKNALGEVRCVRKGISQVTTTAGLAGHWKLDETTGTTAFDSSVNGNDGSILNSYTLSSPGAVGQSISLINEGTIQVATTTGITNLEQASFSIWFKVDIDENTSQHLFDKNGDYNLQVNTAQNNFSFTWNLWTTNGEWETASDSIPTYDQWHNVIITYDADDASNAPNFYLNGALLSSSTSTTPVAPRVENSSTTRLNIGNQNNSGSPINGKIDDFRIYDRVLSITEIAELYTMGSPIGTSTALPQGCPNIGDVCDDGTIYAGLSPDGSVEMFYGAEDHGKMPWNNGNTSGTVAVGVSDDDTGEANTNTLVITDSDSATAGFQPHQAAQFCYDLVLGGADDWYLPAQNELNLALSAITNITNSHGGYWMAEDNGNASNSRRLGVTSFDPFSTSSGFAPKNLSNFYQLRCVRKGPAPRCANPYGLEGQIIYNNTHNVAQYCDGARWISLGKDG